MRPEFGCGIHDYVFDSIDAATVGPDRARGAQRARPLGAAHRRARRRGRPSTRPRPARCYIDIDYRSAATNDRAQPRLPVLRHPGRGVAHEAARDPTSTTAGSRTSSTRRKRCSSRRRCPEWTDHNVSDPGITLIELFAWMTETLVYRLNRVPDKIHVALLDLLGIALDPPTRGDDGAPLPARRRPADGAGRDPRGRDRGRNGPDGERGVDRLPDERGLHDPGGAADGVRRRARRDGEGRRRGRRHGEAEGTRPAPVRDAAQRRRRALPRLRRAARPADAAGRGRLLAGPRRGGRSRGSAAPLGGVHRRRGWEEAEVLADTTGGFNYGSGIVELQLPQARAGDVARPAGARVRCRLDSTTRSGAEGGAFMSRRRSTRSRRLRSARSSRPRTRPARRSRCSAKATVRPVRSSACATPRS